MATESYQVVVIGAGPGGYVAGIRAAQLGLRTAVIEEDRIGGVCLNIGCIPSKSLIHASGLVDRIRRGGGMGILAEDVKVDGKKLQAWKSGIVKRLTTGVGFLLNKNGATVIHGRAEFTSQDALLVRDAEGALREIRFEKCIVAVGARPIELPFLPFGGQVLSYRGVLDLDHVPQTLAVVGGGVIGLELGSVWQRLGSDLTVVELTPSLLPGTDPELVKVLLRHFKKRKVKVHLETSATGVEQKDGRQVLTAKTKDGKPLEIPADVVLVAVGFRPNSDRVGAEKAGIAIDERGHFLVNEHLQTNVDHIYAIGDAAGSPYLAHKASKEGTVAAEHAAGRESTYDVRAMPSVVFTHPEIATTGLQEHEAAAAGREVKIGRFPFTALGRALSMNEPEGFVKIVADAATDEVLGVGAVGGEVTGLIAEATLAIEMGARAEDLALTVHAHPTWPESLMEAAEALHHRAIHVLNP
ncbi:MAG: dihydrolipoyl dehydrogenase [Planctomycetota bacterium]